MAEGVGFEPTVPCGTTDFESVTFDLSDTPPGFDPVAGGWGLEAGKSSNPMTTCGFTVI